MIPKRRCNLFISKPASRSASGQSNGDNGFQMVSGVKEIIPGIEHWPRFMSNNSEQIEDMVATVKCNNHHPFCLQVWKAPECRSSLHMKKGVQSLLQTLRWPLRHEFF